ncbi:MAG: bifunctional phosphoglucose/phosphomannose isomerase [Candidatus Aenigmatarchaeota archaeon]
MLNLYESLNKFPDFIEEAKKSGTTINKENIDNIVISGMGGSAISGNILKNYLKEKVSLPIQVNRNYDLPEFVDENTLLFVISYSGKTEETLSSFEDGKKRGSKIVFITSNKSLDVQNKITIPENLLPRASLPYLFFALLRTLEKSKIIEGQDKEIEETIKILKNFDREKAKILADKIKGKIPIVYAPQNYSSISYRWQTEFNENSKIVAHSNTFTELNHNEIECNYKNGFYVIILEDVGDKSTEQTELSQKLIGEKTEIKKIKLKGESKLAKIFYGIYFGDWVSYYLAELIDVSPEKTENIDRIKKGLR